MVASAGKSNSSYGSAAADEHSHNCQWSFAISHALRLASTWVTVTLMGSSRHNFTFIVAKQFTISVHRLSLRLSVPAKLATYNICLKPVRCSPIFLVIFLTFLRKPPRKLDRFWQNSTGRWRVRKERPCIFFDRIAPVILNQQRWKPWFLSGRPHTVVSVTCKCPSPIFTKIDANT